MELAENEKLAPVGCIIKIRLVGPEISHIQAVKLFQL